MRTILVTGSDTGIGKTHVAATIARLLWRPNLRLQFVKPVETGRAPDETGDADDAARGSGLREAERFTLARFRQPLAPLTAARLDGDNFSLELLLEKWNQLPPADLRIVEGAGGIAVPLDSDGRDWASFAQRIGADRVVLVTPDRLGAINQARLVAAYARASQLPAGLWLNEVEPQSEEVRQSNREALSSLSLWATQGFRKELPDAPDASRQHLSA